MYPVTSLLLQVGPGHSCLVDDADMDEKLNSFAESLVGNVLHQSSQMVGNPNTDVGFSNWDPYSQLLTEEDSETG